MSDIEAHFRRPFEPHTAPESQSGCLHERCLVVDGINPDRVEIGMSKSSKDGREVDDDRSVQRGLARCARSKI